MKDFYLKRAEENLPELLIEERAPVSVRKLTAGGSEGPRRRHDGVIIEEGEVAKGGTTPIGKSELCPDGSAVLEPGDVLVLDLGCHYVGRLSFKMWWVDEYIDAPVRLSVRFHEALSELDDDYSSYNSWLCRSWLQDEVINIDFPGVYSMPRRYAARYVRLECLCSPKKIRLSDFVFGAESSADMSALAPCGACDEELLAIDRVAVNTLKNCMQRVFEDGPKRDRRLWIGDLRLEALANYYTFNNSELVRRCLYLFAAADKNEYGFLPGFVYENPVFVSGSWHIVDYSLLYVVALCDYYGHTGDEGTFRELYPVARGIMDSAISAIGDDGIITSPAGEGDIFIDWCRGLKKRAALEGVFLYSLDIWAKTLLSLGIECEKYDSCLAAGREAALALYDFKEHSFINPLDEGQLSVHAAAWMVLGGVIRGEEARLALETALASEEALKPFTPYMHHYTVEAMLSARMEDEAVDYIRHIWGGMVALGADTFFEAYVPTDPEFSPYGDRRVNSMCHAWSCTPAYFIRKYGLGK